MTEIESNAEIVAAADEARKVLFDLELALEKQIDEMRLLAFKEQRLLNAEEKVRRTQIRASQAEIGDAHIELAYVTLSRLDNSEDVQQLKQKMFHVNQGLRDDLAELKKIKNIARKVADVTNKLTQIVSKVVAKAESMLG